MRMLNISAGVQTYYLICDDINSCILTYYLSSAERRKVLRSRHYLKSAKECDEKLDFEAVDRRYSWGS